MQGIVGIDNSTKFAAIGDNSGIRSLIKHSGKKGEGDRAKYKSVSLEDYRAMLQSNLFAIEILRSGCSIYTEFCINKHIGSSHASIPDKMCHLWSLNRQSIDDHHRPQACAGECESKHIFQYS